MTNDEPAPRHVEDVKPRDWLDPPPAEPEDRKIDWRSWLTVAGVLVAVFLIINLWPRSAIDPRDHPAVGQRLPMIQLAGLVGTDESVSGEDLRGQVALFVFWSTAAPKSIRMLGVIAALDKRYAEREDVRLLPVSCRPPNDADALRSETQAVLESNRLAMPVYWDPDDQTMASLVSMVRRGEEVRPVDLPATVLQDRQGIVRGVWLGYDAGMESQIAAAIDAISE